MSERINADILDRLGEVDEAAVQELLNREIERSKTKFIVLDDDPTGVQTVHDISVYTDWSRESIRAGLEEDKKLFYLLTNSRSMTGGQTEEIHREIAQNARAASEDTGENYLFISRSDSTLRGHYPLETEILREEMEKDGRMHVDGEILCFYFREGKRFTIDNVHYVREGSQLIPAAETEVAQDKTFGYRNSDLRLYIEEKTQKRYPAEDVVCIPISMLRSCDYDGIEELLMSVENFNKVVLNAAQDCDLKVFCVALYRAMQRGKHFLFRSAASLVKVIGGITDRPLLSRSEMVKGDTENGGIVVIGSHTNKTTAQLEELLKLDQVEGIEFNSDLVLDGDQALEEEIRRVSALNESAIKAGRTAVCYTKRRLLTVENDTKEDALLRSVKISQGVQELVGRLTVTPAFVVAKGGITSSDVGTKALAVKRADVMGQIKPGIPVWRTDKDSRFPGIPYIIFPGNVGETATLREAVEELIRK